MTIRDNNTALKGQFAGKLDILHFSSADVVRIPPLTTLETEELVEVAIRGVNDVNDHTPLDSLFNAQRLATNFLELSFRREIQEVFPVTLEEKGAFAAVLKHRDRWTNLASFGSSEKIDYQGLITFYREYNGAVNNLYRGITSSKALSQVEKGSFLVDGLRQLLTVERILRDQIGLLTQSPRLDLISATDFLLNTMKRAAAELRGDTSFEVVDGKDIPLALNINLVQRGIAECWNNVERIRMGLGAKERTEMFFRVSISPEAGGFVIELEDNAGGFHRDQIRHSEKHPPGPHIRPMVMDLDVSGRAAGGAGPSELFYIMRAHGGWCEIMPIYGGSAIRLHFPNIDN